jgi:hypothetical protein
MSKRRATEGSPRGSPREEAPLESTTAAPQRCRCSRCVHAETARRGRFPRCWRWAEEGSTYCSECTPPCSKDCSEVFCAVGDHCKGQQLLCVGFRVGRFCPCDCTPFGTGSIFKPPVKRRRAT